MGDDKAAVPTVRVIGLHGHSVSADGSEVLLIFQVEGIPGDRLAIRFAAESMGTLQSLIADTRRKATRKKMPAGQVVFHAVSTYKVANSSAKPGRLVLMLDEGTDDEVAYLIRDNDAVMIAKAFIADVAGRNTPADRAARTGGIILPRGIQ